MQEFLPLSVAVLTISDTRTEETDTSGGYLAEAVVQAGHQLAAKAIVKDEVDQIRQQVQDWIDSPEVQVVITTGGTGFTGRDSTPEAVMPLFEKHVDGFGELFRQISYQDIGSSTIQSRAVAGLTGNTLTFCVPGSTGACRTAWEGIIREQLDSRHRPCNFSALVLNQDSGFVHGG